MSAAWSVLVAAAAWAAAPAPPEDFQPPPPPGGYAVPVDSAGAPGVNFRAGRPLVATSYFYWYDAESKAHVLDGDGTDALTDHPPTLEASATRTSTGTPAARRHDGGGIDVVLPVYWGIPLSKQHWSDEGLPPLVAARERLLSEGKNRRPSACSTTRARLQHNEGGYHVDLTTAAGRRGSTAPSATSSGARSRHNTGPGLTASRWCSCTPRPLPGSGRESVSRGPGDVSSRLRHDLFLVKMHGWPGEADSEYHGAGPWPAVPGTAGFGPGYDHSAVPGRQPLDPRAGRRPILPAGLAKRC